MKGGISIVDGIFWVLVWFGMMLLYTFLDVAVWRKAAPNIEKFLNIGTIAVSILLFLQMLSKKTHFEMNLLANISLPGILAAIGCALSLFLLLDKGLDPALEKLFPASEQSYQETLHALGQTPVITLLQVCILAPVIEEILMRGYLLGGLAPSYGNVVALLGSSFLFALLHFNMVQTLSAFLCGIVLGLLYLQTGSIFCCILTHAGYNLISYITMILPLFRK